MAYLYVLNYNSKSIIEIELNNFDSKIMFSSRSEQDAKAILRINGMKDTECSWMWSEERLYMETIDENEQTKNIGDYGQSL